MPERRAPFLLAAAVLAAGCPDFGFDPVYRVSKLRVLAVRAEPPELRPGEAAALDALVVSPDGAAVSQFWIACDPDPTKLGGSACVEEGEFRQDEEESGIPTEEMGARILGLGPSVPYGAPASTFAPLRPDDLARTRGLAAAVVLVAFTGTFASVDEAIEKVRKDETPNVIALKRVKVTETLTPNRNPSLAELRAEGVPWMPSSPSSGDAPPAAAPGEKLRLRAVPAAEAAEPYEFIDAAGRTEERTEQLTVSWFTTQGSLGAVVDGSYRVVAGGVNDEMEWTAPAEKGPVRFWAVLRDGRGGAAWLERSLEVK